jgi:16S rRNA (guanine527-N7)-methyltransferase
MAKRVVFLTEVLEWDEAPQKLTPLVGRAEDLARENDLAETFDLVVARSFGPPAVLAECAARFLTVGGYLIVSEPPEPVEGRWNSSGLGQLGLELLESVRSGSHFQVLRKKRNTPEQYPRPVGVPGKKPLF